MRVRTKIKLLIIVWVIFGSILGLASLYISQYFLIALLVSLITIGSTVMFFKCPSCGKPVTYNPVKILNFKLMMWTSWVPKNCSQCGYDLDK